MVAAEVDGDSKSEKKACDDDVEKEESTESKSGEEKEDSRPPFCGVRLTYFDGAGRAELSRLILAAAGIEFEDRRIDSQDWRELKPGSLWADSWKGLYSGLTGLFLFWKKFADTYYMVVHHVL